MSSDSMARRVSFLYISRSSWALWFCSTICIPILIVTPSFPLRDVLTPKDRITLAESGQPDKVCGQTRETPSCHITARVESPVDFVARVTFKVAAVLSQFRPLRG